MMLQRIRRIMRPANEAGAEPSFRNGHTPHVRDARSETGGVTTGAVKDYYERMTEAYRQGFGDIFQGSRPESTDELIDYVFDAAQLGDGQSVLDAGCGIGGPAIAFAKKADLRIEGLTLADAQVEFARAAIAGQGLQNRVSVRQGDFHDLWSFYPQGSFDRVLFLESLCHAEDYRRAITGGRDMLRPGGLLYIKDFYAVDHRADPARQAAADADLARLHEIYNLAMPDLASLIDVITSLGLFVHFVRTPGFEPTYRHWAQYEAGAGIAWNPQSGAPGEVIQGVEILCRRN